jgi:outer membrane lipoprotein carrier protein
MRSLALFSCIALSVLFPNSYDTKALDGKAIVARLESRYRGAHTMQTTFLERYSENGQVVRSEAGVAYFRRPGKMRWEYESPEKNLFVVDGKMAWFYVPADHTATRVPAKQSKDWRTPLALLAGEMKVSRVCAKVETATTEKPETPDNTVLFCTPRGEEGRLKPGVTGGSELQSDQPEQSIYLEVVRATGDLARVLVREKGGVQIEFKFTAWRFDPPLADTFFRFDVPTGVAIVNGESPAESKP